MRRYALGLGSNLGDRLANLREAIHRIHFLGRIHAIGGLWVTAPEGVLDQSPFFNTALILETSQEPLALLDELLRIEGAMGRVRLRRWGPRVIDLDLLLEASGLTVAHPRLSLPHPRMHSRAFVLAPLKEIAPEWRHPVLGLSVQELWEALPPDRLRGVHRLLPPSEWTGQGLTNP